MRVPVDILVSLALAGGCPVEVVYLYCPRGHVMCG